MTEMEPNAGLRPVKVWSSCIRNMEFLSQCHEPMRLIETNARPADGDLVLVRVVGCAGAYTCVEDPHGREVPLYPGDAFVGVLGTRCSGYSVRAEIPARALSRGDCLHLVAVGGLIASATDVPMHLGRSALSVEILGFPQQNGSKINTRVLQKKWLEAALAYTAAPRRVIFVGATSAEAGKTTFVCKAVRMLKERHAHGRVAVVKVVGTGRKRDILRCRDSGADLILDFVDAGWPSTYNIGEREYEGLLSGLLQRACADADYVLVEIGGDLLEGGAPLVLAKAAGMNAPFAFLVNDALGAMQGLSILESHGVRYAHVFSMRQNLASLSARLRRDVKDMNDPRDLAEVVCGMSSH